MVGCRELPNPAQQRQGFLGGVAESGRICPLKRRHHAGETGLLDNAALAQPLAQMPV